ncbi:MAG: primosomal protein N' [Firmicutes bacterium]|nr:primosomal protein N' [Bacillota bacterium]
MYADIIVELKAKKIDKTFTYLIPDKFKDKIKVGIRVLVPFGKQILEGFVLSIENNKNIDYELKEIIDIIDIEPVINEEMLELGKYISLKTLCNLINAYQTMLPSALKAHKDFKVNKKYITYIKLIDFDYMPKNDNQKEIIELLKKGNVLKSELTKISISSINTLLNKKVIEEIKEETYRINDINLYNDKKVILNDEQQLVVNTILENKDKFIPYLLHGVTGSGKTEVYMNIIESILKDGKEVIVLVPEISLTPQMVNLFKSRFKNSIAILHSALSDGEKYDEWRKIERKEVSIVIGARSAIFAPLTNIGLIVLDEEHSDTYKQDNNPKYDAIDIAIKRAKTYNCPIILGSATPSIESYTRAKLGTYKLLELKNRVNKTMPEVKVINMSNEIKKGYRILSKELIDEIDNRLEKNEQIILLLNRRGYSTTITCKECGNTIKCPNCDIPLTYHKNGNKLNCHYCNHTTYKPMTCPECNSKNINSFGIGTEKLEEEVNKLFNCKTIRMDIDTTRKKGSHERIINDFRNKKYNILIGTQMISKGLDFDDVTLVGVVNGDATLNIPDFRSGERTYSLLNQISGRAGRSSKPGKVIIQCFNTDHYSIECASKNDYISFYKEDMNIRKKLKYPPYYNLCLIKLIGTDYSELNNEAIKIKEYLNNSNCIVLGPSPCTIPKIYNKYYIQIIIKYKNIKDIYNKLKFIINKSKNNSKINLEIDLNPKKI